MGKKRRDLWLVGGQVLSALVLGLAVPGCAARPSPEADRQASAKKALMEDADSQAVPKYEKSKFVTFDEGDIRNRSEFADQLTHVRPDMSKEGVVTQLGKPDVIKIMGANDAYVPGDELWLFGAPNADELPVLGTVCFREEQVIWWMGSNNPSSDLPEESDLREILRFMHAVTPTESGDPLHLIRVANRLIPLGKETAIATINEMSELGFRGGNWPHWLVQILFEVPDDPGYMRPPAIGGYGQELQQETRVPRFPTVLIDDVPVTIFAGAMLAGYPESVSRYLNEIGKEDMRIRLFRPPSDPFESLKSLWNSGRWPFPYEPYERRNSVYPTELSYKSIVLKQVLNLVRTVYRPSPGLNYHFPYSEDEIMDFFRKFHKEFKAIGAVWDVEQQMYTLKDGTTPYPLLERVVVNGR